MGMLGCFCQLTPQELSGIIADPNRMDEDWFEGLGEKSEEMHIDIDKAWNGIHFLLTGESWGGELPLADAISGGTEISDDLGYGPPRYLTPGQVQKVSTALSAVRPEDLRRRFDPTRMKALEIYPDIWDEGEESLDYLLQYFESLREFYNNAASRGNAVLLYLS